MYLWGWWCGQDVGSGISVRDPVQEISRSFPVSEQNRSRINVFVATMRAASAVEHSGGMEHKFGSVLHLVVWYGMVTICSLDQNLVNSTFGRQQLSKKWWELKDMPVWSCILQDTTSVLQDTTGILQYTIGYHLYNYYSILLVYYSVLQIIFSRSHYLHWCCCWWLYSGDRRPGQMYWAVEH